MCGWRKIMWSSYLFKERNYIINTHSPKNCWQYYFGLVPLYEPTWVVTSYLKKKTTTPAHNHRHDWLWRPGSVWSLSPRCMWQGALHQCQCANIRHASCNAMQIFRLLHCDTLCLLRLLWFVCDVWCSEATDFASTKLRKKSYFFVWKAVRICWSVSRWWHCLPLFVFCDAKTGRLLQFAVFLGTPCRAVHERPWHNNWMLFTS